MNNAIKPCLESILYRTLPPTMLDDWTGREFQMLFSSLGWRLRHTPFTLTADEVKILKNAGLVKPELLSLVDIARINLLCSKSNDLPKTEQAEFVATLFRKGDNKEREILLKSLILMPYPEQFLATAIDACRAAVQTTFEALACENAYPANYFPAEAFCALVLKALHLQISVQRIVGLQQRKEPALSRMANDFASELFAAGKNVPNDVAVILKQLE